MVSRVWLSDNCVKHIMLSTMLSNGNHYTSDYNNVLVAIPPWDYDVKGGNGHRLGDTVAPSACMYSM